MGLDARARRGEGRRRGELQEVGGKGGGGGGAVGFQESIFLPYDLKSDDDTEAGVFVRLCVSVFVCVGDCVSVYLSLCVLVTVSRYVCQWIALSVSLSACLCVCVWMCLSIYVCLCVEVFVHVRMGLTHPCCRAPL